MESRIPKAKYTVGDEVLVIKWAETLAKTTHCFGTVSLVEANPDIDICDSGLSRLNPGQAPVLYTLKELVPRDRYTLGEIYVWEHEIAEALPNR